jgi:hypothetical protein
MLLHNVRDSVEDLILSGQTSDSSTHQADLGEAKSPN